MIRKIGALLLIVTGVNAQDKGQFESYSNPFYSIIVSESNEYDKDSKEQYSGVKQVIKQ